MSTSIYKRIYIWYDLVIKSKGGITMNVLAPIIDGIPINKMTSGFFDSIQEIESEDGFFLRGDFLK